MIQPNELRVGNKITTFDKEWNEIVGTITLICDYHYCVQEHKSSMTYEYIKPIPLTPDILEKTPFEQFDAGWYGYKPYGLGYEFTWNIYDKLLRWKGTPIDCKYVHNFQNAIFALTGEELQIEL